SSIEEIDQHVKKLSDIFNYEVITMPQVTKFDQFEMYILHYATSSAKNKIYYIKNIEDTLSVLSQHLLNDNDKIYELIDLILTKLVSPLIFSSTSQNTFTYILKNKCQNIVLGYSKSTNFNIYQITENALLGTV